MTPHRLASAQHCVERQGGTLTTAREAGTPTRLVRSNALFCAAVILGTFIIEGNLLRPWPFAEPDSWWMTEEPDGAMRRRPDKAPLAEADSRAVSKQRR